MPDLAPSPIRMLNMSGGMVPNTNLAGMLMRHMHVADPIATVRALSPLTDEAQRLIDDVVLRNGLENLNFLADVLAAGLTYPLDNWLGVPELYWESEDEAGTPVRSMDPNQRRENFLPNRTGYRLPIPCTSMEFHVPIRMLMASRRAGAPIDLTNVEQSIRRENEANEDAFINGIPEVNIGGNSPAGLLTAPNATAYPYVGGKAIQSQSGTEILTTVSAMLAILEDDNFRYGPKRWYVSNADYRYLSVTRFNSTESDRSILTVLEELKVGNGSERLVIRPLSKLAVNRTAMINMTSDVVRAIYGQAPTHVSWAEGPWDIKHVILSCIVPQFRTNSDGQSGVVIGFTS